MIFFEELVYKLPVRDDSPHRHIVQLLTPFLQLPETIILEADVIVAVQIVDANDSAASNLIKQEVHQVAPNESCVSGHEYCLVFSSIFSI